MPIDGREAAGDPDSLVGRGKEGPDGTVGAGAHGEGVVRETGGVKADQAAGGLAMEPGEFAGDEQGALGVEGDGPDGAVHVVGRVELGIGETVGKEAGESVRRAGELAEAAADEDPAVRIEGQGEDVAVGSERCLEIGVEGAGGKEAGEPGDGATGDAEEGAADDEAAVGVDGEGMHGAVGAGIEAELRIEGAVRSEDGDAVAADVIDGVEFAGEDDAPVGEDGEGVHLVLHVGVEVGVGGAIGTDADEAWVALVVVGDEGAGGEEVLVGGDGEGGDEVIGARAGADAGVERCGGFEFVVEDGEGEGGERAEGETWGGIEEVDGQEAGSIGKEVVEEAEFDGAAVGVIVEGDAEVEGKVVGVGAGGAIAGAEGEGGVGGGAGTDPGDRDGGIGFVDDEVAFGETDPGGGIANGGDAMGGGIEGADVVGGIGAGGDAGGDAAEGDEGIGEVGELDSGAIGHDGAVEGVVHEDAGAVGPRIEAGTGGVGVVMIAAEEVSDLVGEGVVPDEEGAEADGEAAGEGSGCGIEELVGHAGEEVGVLELGDQADEVGGVLVAQGVEFVEPAIVGAGEAVEITDEVTGFGVIDASCEDRSELEACAAAGEGVIGFEDREGEQGVDAEFSAGAGFGGRGEEEGEVEDGVGIGGGGGVGWRGRLVQVEGRAGLGGIAAAWAVGGAEGDELVGALGAGEHLNHGPARLADGAGGEVRSEDDEAFGVRAAGKAASDLDPIRVGEMHRFDDECGIGGVVGIHGQLPAVAGAPCGGWRGGGEVGEGNGGLEGGRGAGGMERVGGDGKGLGGSEEEVGRGAEGRHREEDGRQGEGDRDEAAGAEAGWGEAGRIHAEAGGLGRSASRARRAASNSVRMRATRWGASSGKVLREADSSWAQAWVRRWAPM